MNRDQIVAALQEQIRIKESQGEQAYMELAALDYLLKLERRLNHCEARLTHYITQRKQGM